MRDNTSNVSIHPSPPYHPFFPEPNLSYTIEINSISNEIKIFVLKGDF
jgi:hypothetical protein